MNQLQLGKSPGTDGLPIEFHKVFWNALFPGFVNVINTAYRKSILSITLRSGSNSIYTQMDRMLYHLKNGDQPYFSIETSYC